MELKTYFAQDASGNIMPGAAVTVYEAGTATLATGLQDESGSPLANPFTADSSAKVAFYAPDGLYDITVVGNGRTVTIRAQFVSVDEAGVLRGDLAAPGGSALVGHTPDGVGAEPTTVGEKLKLEISVFDFMTDAEKADVKSRAATLNVTAAFDRAIAHAHSLGGGIINVPAGTYLISNLEVKRPNVYIRGAVSQYTYEVSYTGATIFKVASGSDWGVLFGAGATTAEWGIYSGLSNVVLDGNYANEFGLCVCVGNTVITDVTVIGFQYGCVAASFINSNIWERCNFFKNQKIGFAAVDRFGTGTALEAANPGVASYVNGYNTTFTVRNCNMRENGGYGIVIINALGAEFTNCVVESNVRSGLWTYRQQLGGGTDNKYNRLVTFNKVWFENNWQGYVPGNAYSNTGWRYVDYTPGTIYDPVADAGYVIHAAGYDSNTYPEGYEFNYCSITGAYKVLWAKRSKYFKFYQCILIGVAEPASNVTLSADALKYTFERCEYDPFAPNATAQKAHILTQGTGTWIVENEKTNTAAGVLSDYKQGLWTPNDASGAGLTLSVPSAMYTKIGNKVTVNAWITYPTTANASQAAIGNLPFAQSSPYGGMGFTGYSTAGALFARTNDGSSLIFVTDTNANVSNTTLSGKTIALTYEYFVA